MKATMELAVVAMANALRPFAAQVHDDGVDAPYPEDKWYPLLIAAKTALDLYDATKKLPAMPDLNQLLYARRDMLVALSAIEKQSHLLLESGADADRVDINEIAKLARTGIDAAGFK